MRSKLFTTLLISTLFSGLMLPTFSHAAGATTPDDEQPVNISADSLDIQEQAGVSIYSGNVEVTQGSMTLKGDKITIQHPNRALQSIKVIGKPALFKRLDPETQTWVNGEANTINYNAQKKIAILIGSAKVEQPGKHLITGPELTYDMLNKTLKAQSTPQEKRRISVTLTPEPKK